MGRGARFAFLTAFGIARLGFFIPYRHAGRVPGPGTRAPYGPIERLFAAHEAVFQATLDRVEDQCQALESIGGRPPAPRWDQDWFPRLDAAVAYTLVRAARPRLIVEVGSGHSTRFLARAVADEGSATRIVAIDPQPRARIPAVEHLARDLGAVGHGIFGALGAGDVLFIDSSHILMPGTDVDVLLNRVLPVLPAGALVHVHDVFLPDDYPPAWSWRGYNEQLGIAALLNGGGWQPLFASRYVVTRRPEWLKGVLTRLPLVPGALETSLWLRKR